MVWATAKCTASEEPEATVEGGEPFIIERMLYRWPTTVCHDLSSAPDGTLCTGVNGDRRTIVDPRQVTPPCHCPVQG